MMHLVFLLLLCPLHTVAAEPSLAKIGCDDRCGNVTIPYPFGMGTNCSIDEWFEIDCKHNSSKPFLKKLNMEVLEIMQSKRDHPGRIRVNNPVLSSYCNRSSPNTAVDLRGSPFLFSQTSNRFTAAGCNSRALIANIGPGLIGCDSPCDGGCCQTSIPSYLRVFNVSFERAESCKYAFLVESSLFRPDSSCVAKVQDLEYVPAVMEWGLSNSSTEGAALVHQGLRSMSFTCYSLRGTIQCYCCHGYTGTPYLPYSCQDINECEDPNICSESSQGHTCINEVGSYRCQDMLLDVHLLPRIFALSTGFAILLALGLVPLRKQLKKKKESKRKKMFFKRNGGRLLEQQLSASRGNMETTKIFTSKELETATDHFNVNRILGEGGQGTVYKGIFPDGRTLAVKKSKIESESTIIEQFINELVILSRTNHRNIVKLLGCCLETEIPLLVYEFVPNGTLSQYLHGQVEGFVVSWEMRLQIATEVAGALSYLHSAASIPIYHRDIKSSNILLDHRYKAKVADFGISRSVSIEQTHLSTHPNGTFGYFDLECVRLRRFTDKSDVFSFGVVLVELLTGLKAVFTLEDEGPTNLAIYFTNKMETGQLSDILDTLVAEQGEKLEVMEFAKLAKICVAMEGRKRPRMVEVMMELERIGKLHKATTDSGEAHDEGVQYMSSSEVESREGISRTDIGEAPEEDFQYVSSPEVECQEIISRADGGEAHDKDVLEYVSSPEVESREGISRTDSGEAQDEDVLQYVSSPEGEPHERTGKLHNTSTDNGKARDEDVQDKNSPVSTGPYELEKFLFFS